MNRQDPRYKRAKQRFLAERETSGWFPQTWTCNVCGNSTQTPELDHIKRIGMGGGVSTLDESNWQLLCRDCHEDKDGGMKRLRL